LIARVGLALAAVVVIAWLGVIERGVRLQHTAIAESSRPPIGDAYRDFRRARLLNPDTAPDVLIALLDSAHGKPARSVAELQAVTRREPENLFAWVQIYKIAHGNRMAVAEREALREMARLDPVDFSPSARAGG
jgi:hypothetical protein